MAPPTGDYSRLGSTTSGLAVSSAAEVREVWAWNLDQEFGALVDAVCEGPQGAIVALDMEFPGFIRQEPRSAGPGAQAARYQALRENVDHLQPIQLGAAVAGPDGTLRGVWSFNFNFNLDSDLHTTKAVAFLRNAGIDFSRLATEGIEATALGLRLAGSRLFNNHKRSALPQWVTFSGTYDLGYLMKLLTANRPLPSSSGAFNAVLSSFCPSRHELRDDLPHGSLDSLARKHGVHRCGVAHTAGSDALLTLELFLRVGYSARGKLSDRFSHTDLRFDAFSIASQGWGQSHQHHGNDQNLDYNSFSYNSYDNDAAWGTSWDSSLAQSMAGWETNASWNTSWQSQQHQQIDPTPSCMFWSEPAHKTAWWTTDSMREKDYFGLPYVNSGVQSTFI